MDKNLILFHCGQRSGHFGQGAYFENLLAFFKVIPNINLTIVKTDCDNISETTITKDGSSNIISIPPLISGAFLTGESHSTQLYYSQKITGIIYEFLRNQPNLIFWVNSIDYLNICREANKIFPQLSIIYVHHSFTWKYFLNIPDDVFEKHWRNANDQLHPKAFEMTGYQQEMATLATKVVTVTKHAKIFFNKVLDVADAKISVIYNGITSSDNHQHTVNKQNMRKKYGFSRLDQIILFSGRITKDKGFPDLLKAFKLVADKNTNLKLVVLGAGYIFEQIHLIDPHWAKITFTGELTATQVYEFYQLADIGVIPSLHEQCSFTAIEMRMYKLPIIVSATDGLDELFTNEDDCLKLHIHLNIYGEKKLNETEFAGQIERLLNDKIMQKKIVENSYKKGLELFTDDKMRRQYEQLLISI